MYAPEEDLKDISLLEVHEESVEAHGRGTCNIEGEIELEGWQRGGL